MLKKYTYKSKNTLITPFHTKKRNNYVKKHNPKSKKYSHSTFSH